MSAPSLGDLWPLARRYFLTPRLLAASSPLVPLVAAADVLCPYLAVRAIELVVEAQTAAGAPLPTYHRVLQCAALMVVLVICQYLSRTALTRVHQTTVYQGCARLRSDLYHGLQAEAATVDAQRRIGESLSRLVSDVQALQDTVLEIIAEAPYDLATIAGVAVMMLVVSPRLGGLILGFFAVAALLSFLIARRGWRRQEQTMERLGDLSARFQEALSAGRTLHALGAARHEAAGLSAASDSFAAQQAASGWVQAVVVPFFALTEYAGLLMVLLYGSWLALHHRMSAVAIVAFLAYVEILAEPLARTGRVLPRLQKAAAASARLGQALAAAPPPAAAGLRPRVLGAIAATGLAFRYAGAARAALEDVHFTVPAGARVAVVGRNGAGKSTFFDLLLGMHRPSSGSLTVDGAELAAIDRAYWRALIGVVPQEVVLMNRSIGENISLGLGAERPERVAEAVRLSGLEATIAALPEGLATVVGERGALLSGGQRQRIAMARLFARDPRVLLLDEPTSALDAAAERDLLPALARLCAGRTTFVISHRPALLEQADLVLLLDQGRLLACNTPQEVWRSCPGHHDLLPAAWADAGTLSPDAAAPRTASVPARPG